MTTTPGAASSDLPGKPPVVDLTVWQAARAELLAKTGANGEARRAYEIAIGLERDASVRRFLQQRQAALAIGRLAITPIFRLWAGGSVRSSAS